MDVVFGENNQQAYCTEFFCFFLFYTSFDEPSTSFFVLYVSISESKLTCACPRSAIRIMDNLIFI